MTANNEQPHDGQSAERGSFPTTQWSRVLQAGTGSDAEAAAALEALCQRYWYPLYEFARRQGRSHHDAEDCTQEFLAQLLTSEGLRRAQPERGRFRTFLLASLRHFLTSDWRRAQAVKRGSGMTPVRLPAGGGDPRFQQELHDPNLTPEQAFDRAWAQSLIEQALVDLRSEYQRSGRERVFNTLAPLLWGEADSTDFAAHASEAGLSVATFTVALHRARRRLGGRLRSAVAETVADPGEVDAELRHLVDAMSDSIARA